MIMIFSERISDTHTSDGICVLGMCVCVCLEFLYVFREPENIH